MRKKIRQINEVKCGEQSIKKVCQIDLLELLDLNTCILVEQEKVQEIRDDVVVFNYKNDELNHV